MTIDIMKSTFFLLSLWLLFDVSFSFLYSLNLFYTSKLEKKNVNNKRERKYLIQYRKIDKINFFSDAIIFYFQIKIILFTPSNSKSYYSFHVERKTLDFNFFTFLVVCLHSKEEQHFFSTREKKNCFEMNT